MPTDRYTKTVLTVIAGALVALAVQNVIPPRREWSEAVWRAAMAIEPEEGRKRIELLAELLVEEGLRSNIVALREIGDRLDGKLAPAATPGDAEAPAHIVYSWSDTPDPLPTATPCAIEG